MIGYCLKNQWQNILNFVIWMLVLKKCKRELMNMSNMKLAFAKSKFVWHNFMEKTAWWCMMPMKMHDMPWAMELNDVTRNFYEHINLGFRFQKKKNRTTCLTSNNHLVSICDFSPKEPMFIPVHIKKKFVWIMLFELHNPC